MMIMLRDRGEEGRNMKLDKGRGNNSKEVGTNLNIND